MPIEKLLLRLRAAVALKTTLCVLYPLVYGEYRLTDAELKDWTHERALRWAAVMRRTGRLRENSSAA